MDQYVNLFCRSVFLELRRIGHLRRHLTVGATKKLVSSFVLSRLDYCNSLLAGLPENRLGLLQRVQNNAARLVLGRRGRNHATPLLRSLHWLPVRARIEYKISRIKRTSQSPERWAKCLRDISSKTEISLLFGWVCCQNTSRLCLTPQRSIPKNSAHKNFFISILFSLPQRHETD